MAFTWASTSLSISWTTVQTSWMVFRIPILRSPTWRKWIWISMINRSLKSGLWMLILKSGSFFVGLSYKFRIWSTWLWHFIAKLVQRRSLNFDAKIWIHWSLGPPNFRRASIWKYSLAWNPPNQISSNWQDRQWYPAADLKLIWWLHCSQIVCKNVAFLGNSRMTTLSATLNLNQQYMDYI